MNDDATSRAETADHTSGETSAGNRPIWLQGLIGVLMALVALAVVALLIGFLLPSTYRVARSIVIDRSPEAIHAYVSNLKTWPQWTTWNTTRYPALEFEYHGPTQGAGAAETWTEPEMGSGRLEIIASDPEIGIEYRLEFEGLDQPLIGEFRYEPRPEGGTKVTWSARGNLGNNPINRYFGLLFDSMLGPDYETGLANLKQVVEARADAIVEPAGE